MFGEIFLAIVQAATEFLPVSSSGHLALFSSLISAPNLFFFTALHFASLFAVLIFTRKEIFELLTFKKESIKQTSYILIGIIPAGLVGFFFHDFIEKSFSNMFFVGLAFIFTGFILFMTKHLGETTKLNAKNSFLIGLFQVLALFPGISRSGMTISAGIFSGLKKETAMKFSFLMFLPLTLGAVILELGDAYFSFSLLVSFLVCFLLSLVFLNLLYKVTQKGNFWIFSIYCWIVGIITLVLSMS